MEDEAGVTMTV